MANEKHFRDVPKKVRLIDANAFQFEPDPWGGSNGCLILGRQGGKTMKTVLSALKRMIENAPTVDAVEVVRCKDCRHWQERWKGKYSDEWHGYCDLDDEPAGRWESDFCSYGERREGE